MIPLDLMDPANNFYFENVTVFGIPMIFTTFRIDRGTIPRGLYAYDLAHSSEDGVHPVKLAPFVLINHLGTVLSTVPVQFSNPENACLYFRNGDWNNEGSPTTLETFIGDRKYGKDGDEI